MSSTEPAPSLQARLAAAGMHESDFEESFIRSSGNGGQNVNKVSTCVLLRHLPSGLSVKAMVHRTQAQNRVEAWNRLLEKMEGIRAKALAEIRDERERLRRTHRKPSRAAHGRRLEQKKRRSDTRSNRSRPSVD